MNQTIRDSFEINFDDKNIYLEIRTSETSGSSIQIKWADIIRICFKPGDYIESDEIYIFINHQEKSYRIPTEAGGGFELWMEIIRRGLFDAQLAIDISFKSEGVFCWPEG